MKPSKYELSWVELYTNQILATVVGRQHFGVMNKMFLPWLLDHLIIQSTLWQGDKKIDFTKIVFEPWKIIFFLHPGGTDTIHHWGSPAFFRVLTSGGAAADSSILPIYKQNARHISNPEFWLCIFKWFSTAFEWMKQDFLLMDIELTWPKY